MNEDTFERIGQFFQLAVVVAQQLPRDILDSREKIQRLIDNPGEWGPRLRLTFGEGEIHPPAPEKEVVEETLSQLAVSAYPAVGEIFELTFDGDALENQPLEIVRYFGYNPEGWNHKGLRVGGKQTCRFKLVQVDYRLNLDVVQERLKAHGKNPGGQWMKAFKAAYPQPDGRGPVGVADASWLVPNGRANFPTINTYGNPDFRWAGGGLGGGWRWLVAVE